MYFMMYGVEKQLWCLYRHYLTAYATSNKLLSIQTAAVEKPSDELYPIKTHSRKSKLQKRFSKSRFSSVGLACSKRMTRTPLV